MRESTDADSILVRVQGLNISVERLEKQAQRIQAGNDAEA